jgi:hypothetical protein
VKVDAMSKGFLALLAAAILAALVASATASAQTAAYLGAELHALKTTFERIAAGGPRRSRRLATH